MSKETMAWLNQMCLVGFAEKRKAWHWDPAYQGDESNHYTGPIPYADVVRRLFPWKPQRVRTANLIPCSKAQADMMIPKLDRNDNPVLDRNNEPVLIPVKVVEVPDMRGVVRSDTYDELGHHSKEYRIHDYEEWLLKLQSNVIGDSLSIIGAGLLRQGAQAYVQACLPETVHDDTTGMEFWPYIMASTSLDGSLATTFSGQTLQVVCDNTRAGAEAQGELSGRIYKAKHTSRSLDTGKIKDVRQSLGIIHQTTDNMMNELHELAKLPVTSRNWVKVMDIILPVPEGDEVSQRQINYANNRRDELNETYYHDPMANMWRGTALGVVQAVNTYATHTAPIKGNRMQRNMEKIITGKFNDLDNKVMNALAEVLHKPELATTN